MSGVPSGAARRRSNPTRDAFVVTVLWLNAGCGILHGNDSGSGRNLRLQFSKNAVTDSHRAELMPVALARKLL